MMIQSMCSVNGLREQSLKTTAAFGNWNMRGGISNPCKEQFASEFKTLNYFGLCSFGHFVLIILVKTLDVCIHAGHQPTGEHTDNMVIQQQRILSVTGRFS